MRLPSGVEAKTMRSTPLLALTLISLACGAKAQSETTSATGDETTGTTGDDGNDDNDDNDDGNDDDDDSASASMSASANTTTPTSDTEEDDTDPDTGGGFIGEPDNGAIEAQCDPGAQDCPRGQKCTSYVSTPGGKTVDATHCVDVIGDDLFGETCERMVDNDTCAAGFFCMTDVSGHTGMGVCLEYCSMGVPCEFGGECFAFNDGTLPVCQQLCDPLLQDCPGEQGCYAAFSSFVCATPGPIDGMGQDGASCATIQGCDPGLLCRTGTDGCQSDTGCCTPVCDLSEGAGQCTAPEECVQALDDPPPSLQDVGFCGIPE
jgi:hypothetical protein